MPVSQFGGWPISFMFEMAKNPAILTEKLHGFSQSLQENAKIIFSSRASFHILSNLSFMVTLLNAVQLT
jgi:hypothetical protein